MTDRATAVLHAFARSDVEAIDRLCADDVLLWGTDTGEAWRGKTNVLAAFAGTYDLGVRWLEPPLSGSDWAAGPVEFDLGDGARVEARVTMVFHDGLLVHGHYSVAARP
jgi:ketosteroid isomerase-like protein